MTVIRPNSVSGITSITAQANEINFFRSNGTLAGLQLNGVNFNTTTGVSTFNNLDVGGVLTYQDVTNVDSVGIITARSTIDAQGDISIADKIIHTGDTDTAIRFPAADTITGETGGSERLRITSAGKVGIGTNNPSEELVVYGDDPKLEIQEASVSSKVILGTGTATGFLHIHKADGTRVVQLNGNGDSYFNGGQVGIGTNTITDSGVLLEVVGNASQKARLQFDIKPAIGTNDGEIASILFRNNADSVGYILCNRESAADDAYIKFGTQKTGEGVTERLRIDSSGDMGLGTGANIDRHFHVEGTDNVQGKFQNNAAICLIEFEDSNTTAGNRPSYGLSLIHI